MPAILEGTTEVKPEGDTLAKFLVINGELRRKNNEKIASFATQTAPEMLWRGVVFHPFTNTAVESAFADHRTYIYKGKEVDQQVHLGFDLASFAGTPIVAANRGKVLFADELGIYGNCVILDHGMGVQSLYAHLSSIDVKAGQTVEKEQQLGRSGMTGLAGGDHLHFTMLVNGQMVNPVEWWDAHWIEDRILRKLKAAGARSRVSRDRSTNASHSGDCRTSYATCDTVCDCRRRSCCWRRPACSTRRRMPRRSAPPPPDAKRVDAAKAGNVSGRVMFDGPVPAERRRSSWSAIRSASSAHKDGATFETFVSENGGLDNVFVYVKDGLGSYYFDVAGRSR